MDKRKATPKILAAVLKKCQEELTALIGHQIALRETQVNEGTAETLFDALEKNQVLADLQVEGERPGTAYLTIDLADALLLGGTLIMLPESELAERIENGEFGEDEADAFGEIVNICSGVLTKLFTDLFPDEIRFVKSQQQTIDPLQCSAKGELPIPDGTLWIARGGLELDDKPLSGLFQIVIPAGLLGLDEAAAAEPETESRPAAATEPAAAPEPAAAEPETEPEPEAETEPKLEPQPEAAEAGPPDQQPATLKPTASQPEAEPQAPTTQAPEPTDEALITEAAFRKLLQAINRKLAEEVGGFLGQELQLSEETFGRLTPEALYEEKQHKQVVGGLRVEGDAAGTAFVLADLPCGITLGGTLIMLPESELEERLQSGEFGSEDADAFGEIVNIIAGIYTALFNDCYPRPLRFVKTELQLLDPLAAAAGGDSPLAAEECYRNRVSVAMGGNSLGCIDVVIPLTLVKVGASADKIATAPAAQTQGAGNQVSSGTASTAVENPAPGERTIVIIAEDETMANDYLNALEKLNVRGIYCQLQEDGREVLQQSGLRGAVLVMGEVREQGIAAAIKIKSIADQRLPLIAAGPNWTRSLVLQAVKYGVRDILVTPASSEQIQEKIRANLAV